ncbi:MAG TPA: efflux RND transporter periplasmic adaptor subunit [Gemmatimonadales bacterium]|jgi:RND family efflux transporter MFP subunit|nr:efflux RND transporter periplasmic adaptor subunit [Gemmatimonadales bacterium]
MQTRRFAVPGVLSVAILSLGALTLGRKPQPPAAPPLPTVTVAPVAQREVAEWDEFTGRLQAVDQVEIRPRVSGYITRVMFDEGKEVRKGEVLFEIDPRPYQAELARAQAELEGARSAATLAASDVERAGKLVKAQAISREEYDSRTSAEAQGGATVRAAEAAVRTARLNLEWTRVRSPIAGRVSNALVTPGNLVQAGPPEATLLTTVVSMDPMYLYFDSDEQTYLRYAALARKTGTNWRNARLPVYLGLGNETGFPHEGRLDFVDNQVDPNTGTIRTRAVFSNRSRALTPGLFARVKLVGGQKSKALLVRDAAIGTDQDRKFVLVLGKGDTLAYRPIVPGRLTDDGLRVVTSGLTPDDRVVVNGLMRVRPGVKVTASVTTMESDSTATGGGR